MPHDPVAKPSREVGADFGDWSDLVLKMCGHDLGSRLSIERIGPGQAVVINAADGIHVGALVKRVSFELLGRHEADRSEDGVIVGNRLVRRSWQKFGESKVHELDVETSAGQPGDHEVAGLDIAMDQVSVLRCDESFLALKSEFAEISLC
jgi:hypothetical protein